jgi:CHAT domain-containing protein
MKKITILFFLCLLFASVSAQSVTSDSLFAIGVTYYQNEEYEKAINYFLICDSLDMNDITIGANRKNYSKMWLSSSYYKQGQEEVAKSISPDYYCYPPVDRRKTVVSDSLASVATALFEEERYDKALEVLTTCAKIEKDSLGEYSIWYKNTINECGYLCFNMENYDDAIKYGEIANRITLHLCGINSVEHVETLTNLISYYGEIQEDDSVKKLLLELEDIKDSISYESNEEHADALMELSGYYEALDDYQEAVRLITKANNVAGEESENRGVRNFYLFEDLVKLENYEDAIAVGTETVLSWKNNISESDTTYVVIGNILTRLASCYDNTGNYLKAIELCNEALNIYNKPDKKNDIWTAGTLNLLASSYNELGLYDKAIKSEKDAVEIIKNAEGKLSPKYAIELSNLAYYYSQIGNDVDAFALCEEAYNIVITANDSIEESDHLLIRSNLATHYAELGNYSRAVELNKEVLAIRSQTLGEDNFEYAMSLNNLATHLSHTDDYDIEEVISIQEKSLQILEQLYGKKNQYYIEGLSNLAVLYDEKKEFQKAIILLKEALSLEDDLHNSVHPFSILLHYNIANTYSGNKDYDDALYHLNKAYSLMHSCGLEEKSEYIKVKIGLFHTYIKNHNMTEAMRWMKETYNSIRNQIVESFPRLTAREREYYWNLYSEWFYSDLPQLLLSDSSNVTVETLYNSALLSKGILLGTNIEVDKLIGEENPSLLTDLYNLRQDQMILDTPRSLDLDINLDSIRFAIEYAERHLLEGSQIYNRLQYYYSITFDDVVNALGERDIAIEFVTLPEESKEKYYALCLKKGYKSPHLIQLFDNNQLKSVIQDNHLVSDSIFYLVWKPLTNELQGVDNLFFSPIGELFRIPIESAPLLNEDGTMADKYKLYRLSSTRELALSLSDETSNDISSIALYGGLNYNSDPSNTRNENFIKVPDLSGTKDEVDSIIKLLPEKLQCYIYEGDNGTEASFKAFSGSRLNILHCATHAYYWNGNNVSSKYKRPINLSEKATFEDKALTHSGLYLSDVNKLYDDSNTDDGVLSAYEISKLDFRRMRLAVLSACKTGLGALSGDGVFGLQRGFKKAGAKSIIMSLWKVDDLATQIIMTEFYKNYFSGTNKHESLCLAQRKVREHKDKDGVYLFKDPYYWAGFIILD